MQGGTIKEHHGSWFLYFREDVLDDGKVIRKKRGVRLARIDDAHRTEASVRHLAEVHLAPINAKTARPESTQTLQDFLEKVYLPMVKANNKPSTHLSYLVCHRLILPHLNGLGLRDVRTPDVGRILKGVAATKTRAKSSLSNCRNYLSGAFKFAINEGHYTQPNPVRDVITPKGAKAKPENCYAYSFEELTAILNTLPEPARTAVLVAGLTGLRHGEIRGLRWADFTGNELAVRRNVWGTHVGEVKTAESAAPVPCVPFLKKALEAHRRRELERCPGIDASSYIFSGERCGRPLVLANTVRRVILPELKKAGLDWHGWHSFRRGLGSNLNRLGVDDSVIQKILRHADVATTQAHYIKVTTPESQAAMKLIERAFKKG